MRWICYNYWNIYVNDHTFRCKYQKCPCCLVDKSVIFLSLLKNISQSKWPHGSVWEKVNWSSLQMSVTLTKFNWLHSDLIIFLSVLLRHRIKVAIWTVKIYFSVSVTVRPHIELSYMEMLPVLINSFWSFIFGLQSASKGFVCLSLCVPEK